MGARTILGRVGTMGIRLIANLRDRLFRRPMGSMRGPLWWPVKVIRLIWLALEDFFRNEGLQRAAALAFATVLSLIPAGVLFVSFAGLMGGGDQVIEYVKAELFPKLAPSFQEDLSEWMDKFLSRDAFKLTRAGLMNVAAIIGLVMAATGMMVAAERNLNIIFRANRKRSYLSKLRTFWLILTISPMFLMGSMAIRDFLIPDGGMMETFLGSHWLLQAIYDVLVPVIVGLIGFTLIYMALPSTRVRFSSALIGGFFSAILWEGSKHLFFIYLDRAQNVTSFYPQIAALPLFLLWLYLNWAITLLGAEVAYVHQNLANLMRLKGPDVGDSLAIMRAGMALLHEAEASLEGGEGEGVLAGALTEDLGIGEQTILVAGRLLAEQGALVEDAAHPGRFFACKGSGQRRLVDAVSYILDRSPDDAVI